MAGGSFPAFPFPRDVLSTPVSTSLLLSMDSMFDMHGAFSSSSMGAPALSVFPDFQSSNPFDDPTTFLGPPMPAAAAAAHKGGFLAPPIFGGGMGWDDEDEIEPSVDASSMGVSASLENAVVVAAAAGGGGNDNGNVGGNGRGKKKGMPAKNLMAERRRRKKLNDRLYMLRSVVPKISKFAVCSTVDDPVLF